jgi:hypothetical protein
MERKEWVLNSFSSSSLTQTVTTPFVNDDITTPLKKPPPLLHEPPTFEQEVFPRLLHPTHKEGGVKVVEIGRHVGGEVAALVEGEEEARGEEEFLDEGMSKVNLEMVEASSMKKSRICLTSHPVPFCVNYGRCSTKLMGTKGCDLATERLIWAIMAGVEC